jgi:hypothetical protein
MAEVFADDAREPREIDRHVVVHKDVPKSRCVSELVGEIGRKLPVSREPGEAGARLRRSPRGPRHAARMVERGTPEERSTRRFVIVPAHDTHFGGDALALRTGDHASPSGYGSKRHRAAGAIGVDDVRALPQPSECVGQGRHDATARAFATLIVEVAGMDDGHVHVTSYAGRAGRLRPKDPGDPYDVQRRQRHSDLPRQVLRIHRASVARKP